MINGEPTYAAFPVRITPTLPTSTGTITGQVAVLFGDMRISSMMAERLILIRHRVAEKKRPGGKKLLEVEGYTFQALVTNLPFSVPPIAVWRDYNLRAGCEGVIKQLDLDFALDKLCLKKFYATESAMSLAVVAYNLCVLFQRHLGWQRGPVASLWGSSQDYPRCCS